MTIARLTTAALALAISVSAAHAQDSQHGAPQAIFDENADLPAPNPDIEAQMKGQFPQMNRAVPPPPLGALQRVWDDANRQAGIVRFQYDPAQSFKVSTREGMTTTIRLPEWESIEAVILGDQRIYRYQQLNQNTVELWTTIPGSDTSLKILGESQNIYSFYVRSETFNSANVPDLTIYIDAPGPAISGPVAAPGSTPVGAPGAAVGPSSQLSAPAGAGAPGVVNAAAVQLTSADNPSPDWLKGIGFDPSRIRRDRARYGDAELAPNDIFRDDQQTYLCYGENWDDAALMVSAPYEVVDGVDRQVNFRSAHNCMIINSTGPLTLKRGDKVLCIRPDPDLVKPRTSASAARVRPLLPSQNGAAGASDVPPSSSGGAVGAPAEVAPVAPLLPKPGNNTPPSGPSKRSSK